MAFVPDWMTLGPLDPALHAGWLNLARWMYNTVPGARESVKRALIEEMDFVPQISTEFSIPLGPIVSKTVGFRTGPQDTVIVSQGTQGSGQIPNLTSGWADYQQYSISGASLGFERAALEIQRIMGFGWFRGSQQRYWLSGHSYGGAQLCALGVLILQSHPDATVRVVTYGSPRPGGITFQRNCTGLDLIRVYNDDDPIRLVPPHTDEAPLMTAVYPVGVIGDLRAGSNAQVQAPVGYALHNGGGMTRCEEWPNRLAIGELGLLAWLTSNNGFASNLHDIDAYQTRIAARALNHPAPEPSTPAQQAPEPPFSEPARVVAQIEQAAVVQLQGRPFPIPVPGQALSLAPGRYEARRYRQFWAVTLDGSPVIVLHGKREAKKWARQANRAASLVLPAIPAS